VAAGAVVGAFVLAAPPQAARAGISRSRANMFHGRICRNKIVLLNHLPTMCRCRAIALTQIGTPILDGI